MERYNHGQKYLLGSSSITRKLGLETLLLPIDVTLSLTKHIVVRFSFSYQLSFSGTRERRNQDVLERSVRSYPAFWITAMTRTIWDSPHVAVFRMLLCLWFESMIWPNKENVSSQSDTKKINRLVWISSVAPSYDYHVFVTLDLVQNDSGV